MILILAGTSTVFGGSGASPNSDARRTLPPALVDDEPTAHPDMPTEATDPGLAQGGSTEATEAPPATPTWSNKHKQLLDRLGLGDLPAPDRAAVQQPSDAPPPRTPSPTLLVETTIDNVTRARRDRIKEVRESAFAARCKGRASPPPRQAFAHAWRGYETHAFGHDEVRPVTNRTNDRCVGRGRRRPRA